jgi:sugar phosphate permease
MHWRMLCVFAFQNFAAALPMFAFAPIQQAVSRKYSVSIQSVNLLSVLALAAYAPGTFLSQICNLGFGLRKSIIIGTAMTLTGMIISSIGINSFAAVVTGQILCGLAQPFFLNSSSKLASNWFDEKRRDIATSVASISCPLGNAISQLISVLVVGDEFDKGIRNMIYIVLGINSASALLVFFFLKGKPEHPPTISSGERMALEETFRIDV